MTTSTEDFYSNISDALSPEQAAQALAMAETGDTGIELPESGGAPTTTTETDNKAGGDAATTKEEQADATQATGTEGAKPIPEDKQTVDNTVILAKDGKHTIGFEHLEKARTQRDEYRAQLEVAQAQLNDLKAQAQARADAGEAATTTDKLATAAQAAIDKGADVSLFGDFSEEQLAAGIQKLIDQRVDQRVQAAVAPVQAQQQKDAATEHYEAIYGKYPNADDIAQSTEFKAWVDAHPSVVRDAYWRLFDQKEGGTAAQIVEVFDAYSAATKKTSPPPAADPKAAAEALAKAAKPEPPASLTSIPGAHADGRTANEAMADMSGNELYQALEGKTPEQIEAFLNQQM